jgi:tetratricopeptide (TPR) repeat protein
VTVYLDPDPQFKSAEAKYVRFNFHPEAEIRRLADVYCSQAADRDRVVVLAGEEASGRRYLAEAALHRARARRDRVRYSRIDLEGYELHEGSLERYVFRQIEKNSGEIQSRAQALLDRLKLQVKLQTPSFFGISVISMALTADIPAREALELLDNTFEALPAGPRSPHERFSLMLRRLAAEQRVVIHVLDAVSVTESVRTRLLEEAADGTDLLLLFSARSQDDLDTGDERPVRFEVPLLAENEIALAVGERFAPNEFGDDLWRALWADCGGYPGRLAVKMLDLLAADLIVESPEGLWSVSEKALDGRAIVAVFGVNELDRAQQAIAALPMPFEQQVQQFVRLASLCGDAILVRPLAIRSGVPQADLDGFIDALDELEPPLFEDLGYDDPGFPGQLVYRFYNRVFGPAQAQRIPQRKRAALADDLLQFLTSQMPVQTRGMARICLELARSGSDDVRRRFERNLAWWVTVDEADELGRSIRRELAKGKLTPATVLQEVQSHYRYDWPVYRSLALLDALSGKDGDSRVPAAELGLFYMMRTELLLRDGQTNAAWEAAGEGIKFVPDRSDLAAEFLQLRGHIKRILGELEESLAFYEQARDILSDIHGSETTALAEVETSLAGIYKDLGRYPEAETLYRRIIRIAESISGETLSLATSLDNLAGLYQTMNRDPEAEPLCRRALDIYVATLGAGHYDTALTMSNLGLCCKTNGKLPEAASLLEFAAQVIEVQAGPHSPVFARTLDNLGCVYGDLGRHAEAKELMARALEIFVEALGREAPDVAIVSANLAGVYESLHCYADAAACLERSIRIQSKRPDSHLVDLLREYARVSGLANEAAAEDPGKTE